MTRDPYLIIGVGRSGTNWLMTLLDLSPRTFCRNEPNSWSGFGYPMAELPDRYVRTIPSADFCPQWDEAVTWAAGMCSERDHIFTVRKQFVPAAAWALGLARVNYGRRWRKLLGVLRPQYLQKQWPLPAWLFPPRRVAEARLVMKVNDTPGWMAHLFTARPQQQAVHIVRHPGGFLNSWYNRWLKTNNPDEVHELNRQRLRLIAEHDPARREQFGDIEALSTIESELWFWRYANETIMAVGEGKPGYTRVVYEDLVADPVAVGRRVFEACGVDWTDETERAVKATTLESSAIAGAWRQKLSPKMLDELQRTVAGSPLLALWPGDPVVAVKAA